jgi:hypothetical protein
VDGLSVQTVARDENYFIPKSQYVAEIRRPVQKIQAKVIQEVYVVFKEKAFSHQLQLFVKVRVKEIYLFHSFLTTTITRRNLNGVYASS